MNRNREVPAPIGALQAFLSSENAGAIALLAATVVALVWANSPLSGSYEAVWHTDLTIRFGSAELSLDLRHWITEGLMVIFFLVVGLEVKRELVEGELRDPRAAALPVAAAIGGMIVPAAIYALINAGGPGTQGWGIPMATDIAFALGLLTVVGRRAPTGLKLFLLALAIVDDIGAILVIAVFYAGGIAWNALAVATTLLVLLVIWRRVPLRIPAVSLILGLGIWLAVLASGIHATIAGVAIGMATPTFRRKSWVLRPNASHAEPGGEGSSPQPAPMYDPIDSPVEVLEHRLHPWSSLVILPLFALANAGVRIDGSALTSALTNRVTLGIVAGLVLGKIVGITGATWLATKTGLARLPERVRMGHVVAVAAIGGIGFTVALFVAGLAFTDQETLAAAKLGVVAASLIAAIAGTVLLRLTVGKDTSPATTTDGA